MQKNIVINLLVLVTFGAALAAQGDQFLLSCNSDDLPCLNNSTHLFLNKTKHGSKIPNLQPIDPLFLKALEYSDLFPVQASYHFINVTVLGLKDMDLIDFKIDMDAKSVEFSTRAHVNVSGDIAVAMPLVFPVMEPFTSSVDNVGLDVPAEALCAVVKDAYKVVIQNIRDVAKILPAKAFIANIH